MSSEAKHPSGSSKENDVAAELALPPSYGRMEQEPESIDVLKGIGWNDIDWLHKTRYPTVKDILQVKKTGIEDAILQPAGGAESIGRFHRRRIDDFVMFSDKAREHERVSHDFELEYEYRGFFPSFDETALKLGLSVGFEELCDLSYLFPLAAIAQVARADTRVPSIMRAWKFVGGPRAFIKRSQIAFANSKDGASTASACCIVCEPPPRTTLFRDADPLPYTFFRTVVGHEVAHQLLRIKSLSLSQQEAEQAASLLALFLVAYRGHLKASHLDKDHLHNEFLRLGFETPWANRYRDRIVDSVYDKMSSPERQTLSIDALDQLPDLSLSRSRCMLGHETIKTLREVAKQYSQAARPLSLAPVASAIMTRKVDSTISLNAVDPEQHGDVSWRAIDRTARNAKYPDVPAYTWRDYQINIPGTAASRISAAHFRSLSLSLAHIRLFGGRYETDEAPLRSEDIYSKCTETERDVARCVALSLYAHRGDRKRGEYSTDLMRFLLNTAFDGLADLAPYADNYFYWSTESRDHRGAGARFRGSILRYDDDTVTVNLWGEDERIMEATLDRDEFHSAGIQEPCVGMKLNLCSVMRGGADRLVPAERRALGP